MSITLAALGAFIVILALGIIIGTIIDRAGRS